MRDRDMRLLGDEEAAAVKRGAWDAFRYTTDVCWIPLAESQYREPTLFVMRDELWQWQYEIEDLYLDASDDGYLYLCLPDWCDGRCYEISTLDLDYLNRRHSVEYAVFDKRFRSILYVGHECTVTFAGTLLLAVRLMLEPIRNEWNVYRGG